MIRRLAVPVLPALFLLALAACDGGMKDQSDYQRADEPGSALFEPIPDGTVPRGMLERAAEVLAPPVPPDPWRGRERFAIHCTPCHGIAGQGDGIVVRHGFPQPPSFHEPAMRALDLAAIVAIVTEGPGAMPSYADRIAPEDRWHIAAYVKALQLSQMPDGEMAP
ncbi:cytochrome c [Arenibaculum sp.]|uniref:c-type cytochrome n=1 Tax=Arenibaculum sp. TaxID=2865862 RepID=UPI002E0F5959|nr:cytochrome c [Arenibaculum sp.]